MQKIRGFIYFKEKSLNDVISDVKKIQIDNINLYFFESLFRYEKKIENSGVFIDGFVDNEYSSKDVINLFREKVGLEKELTGYDVSIESEDTIQLIKDGEIKGIYTGIRIKPPYELDQIHDLANNIGEFVDASNVLIRTVELEGDNPLISIDLITGKDLKEQKEKIEKLIKDSNLIIEKYTIINFNQ